jgi:hypothetical protein
MPKGFKLKMYSALLASGTANKAAKDAGSVALRGCLVKGGCGIHHAGLRAAQGRGRLLRVPRVVVAEDFIHHGIAGA